MNQALEKTDSHHMAIVPSDVSAGALQTALAGDLSRLAESDRLKFYGSLCQFTGLNPLSKPFDWLTFQGKLTLYANKGCAEQLRKIHRVSVDIIERKVEFGCLIVRVKATDGEGRHDEALAAVPFAEGMNADAKALAMMKCETKAKRRVTFSICGLSMLLERDDDQVKEAKQVENVTDNVETAHDRAARLNASLTGTQKETAVEAEVVSEPEPFEQPAQPAAAPAPTVAPAPEQPKPSEVPPQQPPSEIEKLVCEVELVLSEHPAGPKQCVEYMVSQKKIEKGKGLATVDKVYLQRILSNPKGFLRAVTAWAAQQQKGAAQ